MRSHDIRRDPGNNPPKRQKEEQDETEGIDPGFWAGVAGRTNAAFGRVKLAILFSQVENGDRMPVEALRNR